MARKIYKLFCINRLITMVENNTIPYDANKDVINNWIEPISTYFADVLGGKNRDEWLRLMKEFRSWGAGVAPR